VAKHSLKKKVIILNNKKSAVRARSQLADFGLGLVKLDQKRIYVGTGQVQ
jgi:hypothetical protein